MRTLCRGESGEQFGPGIYFQKRRWGRNVGEVETRPEATRCPVLMKCVHLFWGREECACVSTSDS